MSKKLASGSDIICLDVKVGSGAFMQTIKEAEKLARLMVEIGALANKKVQAVLTNMDEPLGNNIGNSLEVIEAIETLNGEGPKDLETVTFTIGALLMEAANLAKGDEAIQLMKEKIATKEALNKLIEMVEKQGGNSAQIKNPDLFKKAPQIVAFKAEKNGYIEKMETEKIGLAAMVLGAGRAQKDDEIDHTVGLSFKKKIGAYVKKGDVIAEIHAQEKGVKEALTLLKEAIIIGNDKKTITLIEGIIK